MAKLVQYVYIMARNCFVVTFGKNQEYETKNMK